MDRFWDNVIKTETCWLWTQAPEGGGYGVFKFKGKSFRAHRLVISLTGGKIPKNMCVLHKCDVRNCVNPEHLFFGTRADNAHDMKSKHRQKFLSGEENRSHKLTLAQVNEIRLKYSKRLKYSFKQPTLAEIGEKYGVSGSNISLILNSNAWTTKSKLV